MAVKTPWWRDAVVYEIYLRSLTDSSADGVGDIGGIRSRLRYLRDLGVDAVWITPWYRSPMVDGGYDITSYREVDPRFGSFEDVKTLITEAHKREIKVMVDFVPNHMGADQILLVLLAAAVRRRGLAMPIAFADQPGVCHGSSART